jgi:hypothetical protein
MAAYRYVKEQYRCFEPHKGNSWSYADAVRAGKESCATATKNVVEYIILLYHIEKEIVC